MHYPVPSGLTCYDAQDSSMRIHIRAPLRRCTDAPVGRRAADDGEPEGLGPIEQRRDGRRRRRPAPRVAPAEQLRGRLAEVADLVLHRLRGRAGVRGGWGDING